MNEDYAIIIGLQYYPGLDDPANGQPALCGPETDANDFEEWILSKTGGDVPPDNVKTIRSSDYPLAGNFLNARPAFNDVFLAFANLRSIHDTNVKNGNGPRVGRRLYIFMSGHGIAPTPYGNKIQKEAALLMADVDPTNAAAFHYHFPGVYAASWFGDNDCFNQVFLFMDCCRDITIVPASNTIFPIRGNGDNAIRFYAFATKWSRKAREKPMKGKNGQVKVRGIFTKTLLLGLEGAAAEPDPENPLHGVITVASLKSYLYQNMKGVIDAQFLSSEVQEPDIDYSPKANEGRDILIKTAALQTFPFIIRVPLGASGSVIVSYNGLVPVGQIPVTTSPADFSIHLSRGKYLAIVAINGVLEQKIFDVTGIEETGKEGWVIF